MPPSSRTRAAALWLAALCLCPSDLIASVRAANANSVKWSDKFFGYDGPWPAVEIKLGKSQAISLFPGQSWASELLTADYCGSGAASCPAADAGLYNTQRSGSNLGISFQHDAQFIDGLHVVGAAANSWTDEIDLQTGGNSIMNASLALIDKHTIRYPSGALYPMSAGCLSLGAPDTQQVFSKGSNPSDAVNATMIPGYLWQTAKKINSNSFGMHIGAASPRMPGSLYYGGYDKSRVVGDVITSEGGFDEDPLSLADVRIDVVKGESPFAFDGKQKSGLLASGNDTIRTSLAVYVDGCSPYITLPKSTCDAIAANLPVTYDSGLGLYTWNTGDAAYERIVSSASALSFVFLAGSNTKSVTISVPFRHLNLTLAPPLVSTPVPYFPCSTDRVERYVLGRAFLQDAFLGANWGKKKWFLAQAPGPNIPAANSVADINADDETISGSGNDWAVSWDGFWTELSQSQATGSEPIDGSKNGTDTAGAGGEGGLSSGAKIGIGVGVSLGVVGIASAVLAFLLIRRRRASKGGSMGSSGYEPTSTDPSQPMTPGTVSAYGYTPSPPTVGAYGHTPPPVQYAGSAEAPVNMQEIRHYSELPGHPVGQTQPAELS